MPMQATFYQITVNSISSPSYPFCYKIQSSQLPKELQSKGGQACLDLQCQYRLPTYFYKENPYSSSSSAYLYVCYLSAPPSDLNISQNVFYVTPAINPIYSKPPSNYTIYNTSIVYALKQIGKIPSPLSITFNAHEGLNGFMILVVALIMQALLLKDGKFKLKIIGLMLSAYLLYKILLFYDTLLASVMLVIAALSFAYGILSIYNKLRRAY